MPIAFCKYWSSTFQMSIRTWYECFRTWTWQLKLQ